MSEKKVPRCLDNRKVCVLPELRWRFSVFPLQAPTKQRKYYLRIGKDLHDILQARGYRKPEGWKETTLVFCERNWVREILENSELTGHSGTVSHFSDLLTNPGA